MWQIAREIYFFCYYYHALITFISRAIKEAIYLFQDSMILRCLPLAFRLQTTIAGKTFPRTENSKASDYCGLVSMTSKISVTAEILTENLC